MAMRIKIWGSRGSLPSPQTPDELGAKAKDLLESFFDSGYKRKGQIAEFLGALPSHRYRGFGGDTPCIEVRTPKAQVIIDAGSGIRRLGYELLGGPCGRGAGETHIFFTHFHWDHLIGLPFFVPIFIPGNTIHVYAVQDELKEVFKTLFKKPFFPVPLEKLGAKIEYHPLQPRQAIELGDLKIAPYQLDHPDPCWGYRFDHEGKAFSHCVDSECLRVSRDQLGPDLPLYQKVDLLSFDAQYTLMETIEKVNWGHAAASLGLDIAIREQISRVLFMHHDPASNDEKIAAAEAQARHYYESQVRQSKRLGDTIHQVQWLFAHDGMVLDV